MGLLWILLIIGETNGSKFEVYALLGEVYGSGCPLGYLLIQSAKDGKENGKQRYIEELLDHFKRVWKLKPIFTLTDKDMAEINAFLEKFPDAKHQLCFWHCLRAIKIRLSILRRRPKYYDAKRAKKEFDWIDLDFVPMSQSNGVQEEVRIYIYFDQISNFNTRTPTLRKRQSHF
jgi:hypothetical protein